MKAIVLFLTLFLPGIASANWYLRCDPPVTKSADKAATITAKAVAVHLANIDAINAGRAPIHFYGVEDSTNYIASAVRMAYQHVVNGRCAWGQSDTKPAAPYVNVWDKLTKAQKAKVRDLGVAPE